MFRVLLLLGRLVAFGIGATGLFVQGRYVWRSNGIMTGNVAGDVVINIIDGLTTGALMVMCIAVMVFAWTPLPRRKR